MLAACASESLASASLSVLGHPDDEGDDPGRPPYGTTRVGRTASCSRSPSCSRSRSPESHVHFADAESLVEDDVGFDVMSAYSGGARSSSSAFGASGGHILLELKRSLTAEQIPRWYTAEPQFGVLRQPFFRSAREVLGDVVIFEKGPESSEPRFNQKHFKTILTKKEFPFQRKMHCSNSSSTTTTGGACMRSPSRLRTGACWRSCCWQLPRSTRSRRAQRRFAA